jgi:predicted PurR-regulated permease PerM
VTFSGAKDEARFRPVAFGFCIGLGLAFVVMLWVLLASLDQLLMWIALALFIALGLDPVVRFFERRGWPRLGGVMVVLGGFVAIAGTILGILIPQLITQITELVNHAPDILTSVANNPTVQSLDSHLHVLDEVKSRVDDFLQDPDTLGGVFNGVVTAGAIVGQIGFGALIVFVLALYILASLPGLKKFSYSLVPASKRERTSHLAEQITAGVGNYVIGQATVAICNAVFAFIVMSIVGVPYRALLSIGVAMLAFIPLVGGVCAGVLVLVVAIFDPGWQQAVVYAICYFAYLQVEAYVISPRIMKRAVKVPGAVAVISVVAGGSLLGVLGALMAIPVAAAVLLLINEIWVKRQDVR